MLFIFINASAVTNAAEPSNDNLGCTNAVC
jgi:hypothetical protein